MKRNKNLQITILVFLCMIMGNLVHAAVPMGQVSLKWKPMLMGSGFDASNDLQSASAIDFVGDASHPFMYMMIDSAGTPGNTSDDTVAFRFRVDRQSAFNGSFTNANITVGIDVDQNGSIDSYLRLTGNASGVMEASVWEAKLPFLPLLSPPENISPATTGMENKTVLSSSKYSYVMTRTSALGETWDADSHPDEFLDVKIAWNELESVVNSKGIILLGIRLSLLGLNLQIGGGVSGFTQYSLGRMVVFSSSGTSSIDGDIAGFGASGSSWNNTWTQQGAFTVEQTFVNLPPVITGGANVNVSVKENTTAVTTVQATDAENMLITFALSGVDQNRFNLNASTGVLAFKTAPDHENPTDADTNNIYRVTVSAADPFGSQSSQNIFITVTDSNEFTPVINSNGGGNSAVIQMVENRTSVTTVQATDADRSAVIAYSLIGGEDQSRFTINATTGALVFASAPDFESPVDGATSGSNTYWVTVRASDGLRFDDQSLMVQILDSNEFAPVITSNGAGANATLSVVENTTAVTTVIATDNDGSAALTYSISGGADQNRFFINSSTGVLVFQAAPDYEAPASQAGSNTYQVVVRVSDGSRTDEQALTVQVTDLNEFIPVFANGVSAVHHVNENSTAVSTIVAADGDGAAQLSYSIIGGSDPSLFSIGATSGVLTFSAAPDYENPADANTDNIYGLIVQVSDGINTATQTISVIVHNVNEHAPQITVAPVIAVNENSTTVATIAASDADAGAVISFSLSGGADQNVFYIHPTTGALRFLVAPDYENPLDANTDNDYLVRVRASDGELFSDTLITVSVQNVNEAPVNITLSNASVLENEPSGTAIGTLSAADPDAGSSFTFTLQSGVENNDLFAIVGNELQTASTFDYETKSIYRIRVQVEDQGGLTYQRILFVSITDVYEPATPNPTITGGTSQSVSIAENTTAVFTVQAVGNGVLAYSLFNGDDQALFSINATTGALTFIAAPDYENPQDADANNVYQVVIRIGDSFGHAELNLAVTVTDVNESTPSISSDGGGNSANVSVDENTTYVTQVQATDSDGSATLTYSIAAGNDANLFTIHPVSGEVSFKSAPDYETPASASASNVYQIRVQVSDGSFSDYQDLTVSVTDVNEFVPAFTTAASLSVLENQTQVTTLQATDADGSAVLVFSIISGADKFSVDPATGSLSFISVPDFETPGGNAGTNSYSLTVKVSDGLFEDTLAMVVSVTDVNEHAVALIASNSYPVAENQTAVATVSATDDDGSAVFTYSISGTDAAFFSIGASTGQLVFRSAPDFETPRSAANSNTYQITIRVTDGAYWDSLAVAVQVTDVNEFIPEITFAGGAAVVLLDHPENVNVVATITATDRDDNSVLSYIVQGGEDQALFSIDPGTGELSFISAPDHEVAADGPMQGANSYQVIIQVSDGLYSTSQMLLIMVTDSNEFAPVFASGIDSIHINENTSFVTTLQATDQDATSTLLYSLSGGVDLAHFRVNASTGALAFVTAPDYEDSTDFDQDSIYELEVSVTDGHYIATQQMRVHVNDIAEAPSDILFDNTSISERASVGSEVGSLTAVDQDTGDIHTFSLPPGFADNAFFSIAGNKLLTNTTLDYDARSSYQVLVEATDASSQSVQRSFQITVLDVKDSQTVTFVQGVPSDTLSYGSVFTVSAVSSSGLPIRFASCDSTVARVSGDTVTLIGTGKVTIRAIQDGDSDLHFASVVDTLIVAKALLTVRSRDTTRVYGEANPAFAHVVSGWVLNDSWSSIDTLPVASSPATQASPVGSYPILFSGGAAANYTFAFPGGDSLRVLISAVGLGNEDSLSLVQAADRLRYPADTLLIHSDSTDWGGKLRYESLDTAKLKVRGDSLTFRDTGSVVVRVISPADSNHLADTLLVPLRINWNNSAPFLSADNLILTRMYAANSLLGTLQIQDSDGDPATIRLLNRTADFYVSGDSLYTKQRMDGSEAEFRLFFQISDPYESRRDTLTVRVLSESSLPQLVKDTLVVPPGQASYLQKILVRNSESRVAITLVNLQDTFLVRNDSLFSRTTLHPLTSYTLQLELHNGVAAVVRKLYIRVDGTSPVANHLASPGWSGWTFSPEGFWTASQGLVIIHRVSGQRVQSIPLIHRDGFYGLTHLEPGIYIVRWNQRSLIWRKE